MPASSESGSASASETRQSEPAEVAEVTVVLPAHLHARPAGRLAKAAARHRAQAEIEYQGKVAKAQGILGVLGLGATQGETVTIRAIGDGAQRAAEELAEVLRVAE